MNNQLNKCKQDNNKCQTLDLLETQMDAKILQMQEKHANVSRLKLDGYVTSMFDYLAINSCY